MRQDAWRSGVDDSDVRNGDRLSLNSGYARQDNHHRCEKVARDGHIAQGRGGGCLRHLYRNRIGGNVIRLLETWPVFMNLTVISSISGEETNRSFPCPAPSISTW